MPPFPRARLIRVLFALLVLGGVVAIVTWVFLGEEQGAPEIVSTVPGGAADFVRVDCKIVEIDPVRGRMTVELEFTPHGRFDAGGGLLAVPLEVDVSSIAGEPVEFAAERRMFPREVEVGFREGTAADYPFDRHRVRLELLVLEHTDEKDGRKRVPVEVDFAGQHHGYAIRDTPLADAEHGYAGFDVDVARSGLVIGNVIFCLAIMWALTVINVLLLWAVMTRRMELDLTLFGYMSGMIVALYFFREVLPDAPPFLGVFADYAAFFWSELITAAICVVFAIIWYRRLVATPRSDEDGEAD